MSFLPTPHAAHLVTVAACSLNQWALDFDGNLERVRRSIALAKERGARYRLGPELELSGYGCEDHFLESDTQLHCWQSLAVLLTDGSTDQCLCDIGMPVVHENVRYNCRALCLNGRILLIRPKLFMANDGNYRELRWFQRWHRRFTVEDHVLPQMIARVTGQRTVPFGDGCVALGDTVVGCETCEELFTPDAPHVALSLGGVEIIGNGSGSHHELRKLDRRVDLVRGASNRAAAVYLYANQRGCDGGRCYYDGSPLIFCNGQLLAQGAQFCLCSDVEVITSTVNVERVRAARAARNSRSAQAADRPHPIPRVLAFDKASTPTPTTPPLPPPPPPPTGASLTAIADRTPPLFRLETVDGSNRPSMPITPVYYSAEQEIGLGPACWLWDYLRRSGMRGFFLALSGGADSSAVAAIVGIMCHLVSQAVTKELSEPPPSEAGKPSRGADDAPAWSRCFAARCGLQASEHYSVLNDLRRITRRQSNDTDTARWRSAAAVAGDLLSTCYMGVTDCSSAETRQLAARVSAEIGARHVDASIDGAVSAFSNLFAAVNNGGAAPRFAVRGGTQTENLALQNVQARSRMVFGYMLAQLLPWTDAAAAAAAASASSAAAVDSRKRKRAPGAVAEPGGLLVLGSGNVDEALRGYLTKYDCSSADINPIGAVSKVDLRRFLVWASQNVGWPALEAVALATPSAELIPTGNSDATAGPAAVQSDEEEMGMSYEELSRFGRLRSTERCGPLSMFQTLVDEWGLGTERNLSPLAVAAKVRRFFHYYAINRHKLTTLTPAYHAEAYSPDDNRHDLRPFLYPRWQRQFADIDALANAMMKKKKPQQME